MIFHEEPVWKSQTHSPIIYLDLAEAARLGSGTFGEPPIGTRSGEGSREGNERHVTGNEAKGSTSLWFSSEGSSPTFQPSWGFWERWWPFLLPSILGCLQPSQVRALPIWAQRRREYSKRWTEKASCPSGCLSSTWAHQNSQLSSTMLQVADPPGEGVCRGSRPLGISFRRKPRLSQSHAHPLERAPRPTTCCRGFQQPSHCVILTWAQLVSPVPHKSRRNTLSPVQQAGQKAVFEVSSSLLTCPNEEREAWMETAGSWSWSHCSNDPPEASPTDRCVSRGWFDRNHEQS